MPAVRDISWTYETNTADAGLTIPAPYSEENDILLLFVMGDTGAPTWTLPTGFTQVFARNNTCSTICAWKLATSSEPASYVIGSTTAETYNGFVMSIRDAHPTNPINAQNNVAQAAAVKYAMPITTTTVDNCLLIYLAANSTAGVPSLLEGPVCSLIGADGAAESMGVGWGFKSIAGATASNVVCSNAASGIGVAAVVAIAPPPGGAQIIPAYVSVDKSIYLNPLHGTLAFNGDAAIAATADTNFGTTLGGFNVVDASVGIAADTGINSFHSTANLTATASTNLCGAELVFGTANRPNLTGKNLLAHFQLSTPMQNQRLSTVLSNRGVWMGIRSNVGTDYKIWQVLGSDSPNMMARPIPIIIAPDAPSPKAVSGTLDETSVHSVGFWVSGSVVGTTVAQFASLWALDVTTVCGGSQAQPIDIPQLGFIIARGKERISAMPQGSGQLLLLQAVQIGDGVQPTYLDFNVTAIEFPRLATPSTKQVNYNSVPNRIGLTYYAGAGDTIKHRNSSVSSPSPFHWRIHPSSSPSATYDFSNLSIIGAGDVQLRPVTTFYKMTFTNCPTIAQNDALIDACMFNDSKINSGSLIAMSGISNCSFVSSGTGHAIEVTGSAGTITFVGNTFTGYASSDGDTGNEAIYVNIPSGTVTINISGGGSTPSIRTAGATVNVVSGATVTFTGLPVGCDVVILVAGTSTILDQVDQHPGTSYSWGYSGTPTVDVGFIKPGYVPFYIRNLSLGTFDSSIPVSLIADRNYQQE